jgi:branched-chain amino acid transport system permease protein
VEYLLHILILIGIYVIAGVSLNLVCGYTGLLSIAHAAFYGVGAYAAALLGLRFHTPFAVSLAAGIVSAMILGVIVGAPSLRLHEDYFVIATFGFQVITYSVMNNWVSFTGGPLGLPGIPQPVVFGMRISSHWGFLALTWALAALVFVFARTLVRSPFGRVLRAVREDEVLAQSLGKDVARQKMTIFVVGAGLAAIAGCIYAWYITFIDPTSFTVQESIFMLAIVILGGPGNLWGSVLGAVFLVSVPEMLRFVGMPSSIAANMRQILYGLALVLLMMFRPQGLIGEYELRGK